MPRSLFSLRLSFILHLLVSLVTIIITFLSSRFTRHDYRFYLVIDNDLTIT